MTEYQYVWVFKGTESNFPSAIFGTRLNAEKWISQNQVTGILSSYPLDISVYDWAIDNKFFSPKKDHEFKKEFKQKFSSASQEHYHYLDGEIE